MSVPPISSSDPLPSSAQASVPPAEKKRKYRPYDPAKGARERARRREWTDRLVQEREVLAAKCDALTQQLQLSNAALEELQRKHAALKREHENLLHPQRKWLKDNSLDQLPPGLFDKSQDSF